MGVKVQEEFAVIVFTQTDFKRITDDRKFSRVMCLKQINYPQTAFMDLSFLSPLLHLSLHLD